MFEGKGRNKSGVKKDYKYISCVLIGYNFIQLEHIRTAIIVNPACIKKTLKPAQGRLKVRKRWKTSDNIMLTMGDKQAMGMINGRCVVGFSN